MWFQLFTLHVFVNYVIVFWIGMCKSVLCFLWRQDKTNDYMRHELHITGILDKIDEYRRNWLSTLAKNAAKPNPFEIILLQTTRKENNWKTKETLERAVVTLETERIKGSNPWCLWWWWWWWFWIVLFCFCKAWPPLPEPRPEENLPDPRSNHKFARNVVWTFEDIQMLIGTDMPIFGGTTHPCISLRLRYVSVSNSTVFFVPSGNCWSPCL